MKPQDYSGAHSKTERQRQKQRPRPKLCLFLSNIEGCTSSGFHNKVPQTGSLKMTKIGSVTVLEARSPESRC